jgi:AcrR family transcriptional regulator
MAISEKKGPPGGRRELTKSQNRQTILVAARQVFAQMGFGAATVRDIIRATPLASGTFYNYFKSKEEVYQAIRDEAALAVRPRLHEGRTVAANAEEFVVGSFATFFEFVHGQRGDFRALHMGVEQSRFRTDTPEMIAGFEELRADLEIAIGKGLFAEIDCEYLTAAFVGTAFEIAERMLRRETCDPAAAADFATALFLGGIKALPKAP